jgi:hypothetical protein
MGMFLVGILEGGQVGPEEGLKPVPVLNLTSV